ncbi:MAG: outer membrane beta-barrel protein [Desulfuromonadaceae bacterium]|nr:outer membrane beta-barrel protein [Desulfuromonadaceae bacterium]
MNNSWQLLMAALVFISFTASITASAGEFRVPVGITYTSGPSKLMDKVKENYNVTDDFVLPVGLAINPYYSFDSGLGIGGSIGPFIYMSISDGWGGTNTNMILPFGVDLRYTLFRDSKFSPYVRGGYRYPITVGDYISSKSGGLFSGVGIELFKKNGFSLGMEISYDASKIEVTTDAMGAKWKAKPQDVTPCGFMAGIYAVF